VRLPVRRERALMRRFKRDIDWPPHMKAKRLKSGAIPFPIKVKGKGARWFRDDLDHALVRLKGQTSRIFDALSIHSKVCRRMVDYDHRERRRGANEWTGYCCCEKATSCENPPIKPMKLPSGIDHVQSLEVHINNNINPYLAAISRP
jgi:hypothetical protein